MLRDYSRSVLVVLLFVLTLLGLAFAKVKTFKAAIVLEGLRTPVDALIIRNRTYADIATLEKLLGFRIWWSYDEQLLYVGKIGVDVAPVMIRGKTYVPIRPVAKAAGYTLSWDQRTRTVTLVKLPARRHISSTGTAKVNLYEVRKNEVRKTSQPKDSGAGKVNDVEKEVEDLLSSSSKRRKKDESFSLPPVSSKREPSLTFGKGKASREVFVPRYARNNEFLVTVTEVKETDTVKSFYHPSPGKKFVVVFVSQQNISNKIQIYTGRFYLVDDQGNRYDYIEGLSNYWLQVLIPNGINFGSLVFEIPKDRYPAKLVLETYGNPPLIVNLL